EQTSYPESTCHKFRSTERLQTAGQNSTENGRDLDLNQDPNLNHLDSTSAAYSLQSGETVQAKNCSKSTHVIPGVEHVFFEEELKRMEQQQHAAPAGMDIVVLAVDNSKPSDMAFQFYVDNVNRSSYYLHLVHHSNYWGNYEPMDG
ncbi:hypothetical protein EGW08_011838, partial [Elysia chlorotica]